MYDDVIFSSSFLHKKNKNMRKREVDKYWFISLNVARRSYHFIIASAIKKFH